MRWVRRVARMGDRRGAYRVLVGEMIERDHLEDLALDIHEVGWGGMNWIALAQVRNKCRALVNAVMNLMFP